MNALKHITLAAMLAAATGASAQEKMVVYLSDGTTQSIPTSEIDHVEFGTATTPTDKPISVELNENHALHAYITATAPASVGTYIVMYDTKDTFDAYADDAAVVTDDIDYLKQYAAYYGSTLTSVLKNILVSGTSKQLITGILPGTDYTVWAYGLTTDATQTTGLTSFTFSTPAVEKISNTIGVEIGQASDGYPTATFTPDDQTLYYVSGSISTQYNDAQIEAAINSSMSTGIGNYLQNSQTLDDAVAALCDQGSVTNTLSNAQAGKEYYAVAAYVNADGAVCSPIFKKKYTGYSGTSSVYSTLSAAKGTKLRDFKIVKPRVMSVPAAVKQ